MARLRNRMVKADFYGDGDLLRWPRDKRTTYKGLWALAEDSACLEDDVFTWKLMLWASPLDADITVEVLAEWRDELIEARKLIPYFVDGRRFLFIEPFHRHEHPRNPQLNDLPLPPWVTHVANPDDHRKGRYEVDWGLLASHIEGCTTTPASPPAAPTTVVQPSNNDNTSPVRGLSPAHPAQPSPAQPSPVLSFSEDAAATSRARARGDEPPGDPGSSSIEDGTPETPSPEPPDPMDDDDPMDALLLELWEVEGWKRKPKQDRDDLTRLGAAFPRADLAVAIQQLRAKAADGEVKAGPRSALQAFIKQLHLQTPEPQSYADDEPTPGPAVETDWKTQAECAKEAADLARSLASRMRA